LESLSGEEKRRKTHAEEAETKKRVREREIESALIS
jgi:hypothetical protein